MTLADAVGLSLLALDNRRLVALLIRAAIDRSTAEDLDQLPPRHAGEPLLGWACRCQTTSRRSAPRTLARLQEDAQAYLTRAARLGVAAVPLTSPAYPPLLGAIADPPPILWMRGRHRACTTPAVALVGSRAATPYGLAMARRLAADLAHAGVVVVSGLARGIDSSAHAAVVAAGGRTIGVLGCGIDRIYPAEHRELAATMEEKGLVVSELPPGIAPRPYYFPLRNRIISGLSLAVVVVEAPEKSGALITASAAAEQGRDVMVVPGPATGARNRGGHLLIRDGAKVVESADDILEELGQAPVGLTRPAEVVPGLPEADDFTVDEVAAHTGEPPSLVLARLLDLELAGRIQRIGGGRFARVLT